MKRSIEDAQSYALIAVASILPAPDLFPNYLLVPMVGYMPLVCRVTARGSFLTRAGEGG